MRAMRLRPVAESGQLWGRGELNQRGLLSGSSAHLQHHIEGVSEIRDYDVQQDAGEDDAKVHVTEHSVKYAKAPARALGWGRLHVLHNGRFTRTCSGPTLAHGRVLDLGRFDSPSLQVRLARHFLRPEDRVQILRSARFKGVV